MKAYTDLEQSKKLAEILPLESADMEYLAIKENGQLVGSVPFAKDDSEVEDSAYSHTYDRIACWSLAALLDVLQKTAYFIDEDANVVLSSYKTVEWDLGINNSDLELVTESNSVDACYEMILKLHELNLL